VAITSDNPIRHSADDTLGRSEVARSFASQLLSLDASEGLVLGVLGAWGSGKTSFLNLTRDCLADSDLPVLDFNPWMFSGAEQLVESFFVELSAQLKVRPGLAEVGRDLEDYGEAFSGLAWLPLIGPWIERGRGAAKILSKILQRRKEGVGGRRAKLAKALAQLEKPIVVILDDIDRLSTSEIRDVFKLVRLTASFPSIVYLLAFDRSRVEEALAEQGVPGRDYLEKILQLAVDLPAIPAQVLRGQTLTAVDGALANIDNPGPFDDQVWPDVYMEIIAPLIRNMRDVRRFAAAIHGTVRGLEGQIALADVLALEAVRVFLPDVFYRLNTAVEGVTSTSAMSYGDSHEPPHLSLQVNSLLEAAGSKEDVARAMIERLFPAGARHIGGSSYGADWRSRWLRERRVAHEDVLRLYLERVAGENLQAFTEAEQAFHLIGDRAALEGFLAELPVERLQDVIASLETFEDQFVRDHVVPGATALLNLLPRLPQRQRGMFDLDPRMAVGRVVYRLLRKVGDPDELEADVVEILPELSTLSAKWELISDVGYREGSGHKLISEASAKSLEVAWRSEVRSTPVDSLIQEPELLRILFAVRTESDPAEPNLEIADYPEMTLALLQSGRSEARSQMMGTRAVRTAPRLAWDVLVELYGDEGVLRARIDALKAMSPEGADELLSLADRYLAGWRPNDFRSD
jgi:predicted KAP-like P-loop ATPase